MAGTEVREYTNLSDPKDKKLGKGKDKIDDEDITFQHMVAKIIRTHQVAIAELNNLPPSRTVYQKSGNIFFRTTIKNATESEQKQHDAWKAKLEKLSS